MAACRVDEPPRRPSTMGAKIRTLWPCPEKGIDGVETRTNIKSLQRGMRSIIQVQPEESYVKSNPKVEMANTIVRPWRSPKAPHQPEVSADRNPITMVMIVCSRAAPACTA